MHGDTYTVYMTPQSTVGNNEQESTKTNMPVKKLEMQKSEIKKNTTTTTYGGIQALDGTKITERSLAATLHGKAFPIKINITKTS